MLKIFWDKDNIAYISDQINSSEHSHCVLQVCLSLDEPMQIQINNMIVTGKCIVINKNIRHAFSYDSNVCLSILIEPTSSFAYGLLSKMNGDYYICDKENIKHIQQKAANLTNAEKQEDYISFVSDFAEYLGVELQTKILDERIIKLLELLRNCDCYDHTIEYFAKKVALSASRLSHLFREQVGVPLKSYILFHQLEKAFTELLDGQNITNAAMLAGFDSPSHFAATAKKWMGMSGSSSIKDSEFLKVFN